MKKKIFIIGSGWVTKGFLDTIDKNLYDINVISNNEQFIYHPFLVNSIFNNEKISFNLKNKYKFINFKKETAIDFDFNNNKIFTQLNNNYQYDYLILCHGSIINDFNIDGVKQNCFFLKNDKDSIILKNYINDLPNDSNIAVIGCGLTGSEIVGHLLDVNKFNIYAIDGMNLPLKCFNHYFQKYTYNHWKQNKINLYFNSFVKKIEKNKIILNDLKEINFDLAIWCGGNKINPLSQLINKKLNLNNNYGIPIDKYLKINKFNNIWAAGDCTYSNINSNAQIAYQQGIYLGKTFNKKFNNIEPFKYKNNGQVCYIGNYNSLYENENYNMKGKLGFIMMKIIKIYLKI